MIPVLPFPELPDRNGYRYVMRQATSQDTPSLVTLHFEAFGEALDKYIPNNKDGHAWMSEALRICVEDFHEHCRSVAVTARPLTDANVENEEIVAYIRFVNPTKEVWENMYSYPNAIGSMEQVKLEEFWSALESHHAEAMEWRRDSGGKNHIWLEDLATHPNHRRVGLGRALVSYACEIADAMRLEMFVDSSDFGMGLYERFGFVQVDGVVNRAVAAPMIRPVQGNQ
ncbi:hypothetical protein H072_2899 [Dactylellina haptotyla CBS 200.50]|uniref:N-acetyltransferase domain-containing protein n=1 Tax=Dactylellina haptotyla (strain CBS 200.50) TaxID=1284197 RepID=S8BUA5_DACHA|nr:hypothetical protein H072_2899 [Dactylellina haptotyla CBS 200.50]